MKRAQLIETASLYLDGIVTRDGSRVPFAPNCRRTEQARLTGSNAEELPRLFLDVTGPDADRSEGRTK